MYSLIKLVLNKNVFQTKTFNFFGCLPTPLIGHFQTEFIYYIISLFIVAFKPLFNVTRKSSTCISNINF